MLNKKIFLMVVLLISIVFMTSCISRNSYFTKKELDRFGLTGLPTINNARNFKNKSTSSFLNCYMTVSTDLDVDKFIDDVLKMLDNKEVYKVYGHTDTKEMYEIDRHLYLSKNREDYLYGSNESSSTEVSHVGYGIFYALNSDTGNKTMYELGITTYDKENTTWYNCNIFVYKRNYANYTIVE